MDIIFDIDGTIADVRHRLHHIQNGKNWVAFFDEMGNDTAIEAMFELARLNHSACGRNIVSTARPSDYEPHTVEWLKRHKFPFDALYMRSEGDYRKDDIVKEEILYKMVSDGFNPKLAIDDKSNVVDMYRRNGISSLQCEADEPKVSRYAGQTLLHLMVGPSGAGKSSYIEKNYKPSDVVSTDDIRIQLFGDFETAHMSPENMNRTWNYAYALVEARLRNGVFTVLDATNLKARDRKKAFDFVPNGVFVRYILIDRPLDDKIRDRGWRSEELVIKHHKSFQSGIKNILAGDERPDVFVVDKRQV